MKLNSGLATNVSIFLAIKLDIVNVVNFKNYKND
jgi:hypothetical protein